MKQHQSLRNALTLNVVLAIILPILIVGIAALNMLNRRLTEDIRSRNLLLATSLAGEVHGFLDSPQAMLGQLGELLEREDIFHEDTLKKYLSSKIRHYSTLDMIRILDRRGYVTHIAPFDENYIGIDMSGQPFVQAVHTSGEPAWSSTFISVKTRQPTLTLSMPFRDGIVIGYVNLNTLNAVTDRVRIGESGYAALIDREGTILAHPDRTLVSEQVNISYAPAIRKGLAGKEGTFTVQGSNGPEFSSIAIVPYTKWVVAVIQPVEEALLPVSRIGNSLLGGLGVALLLAIVMMLKLIKKTLHPLNQLAERSQKIAIGDYTPLAQQKSYREVDELAKNFALMIEAVKSREDVLQNNEILLRQSDARYRRAEEIGHVGNWEYDLKTSVFWGSDEAKRLYGFEPDSKIFTSDEVENCIPERERVHQALIDLIEQGSPYDLEFDILPKHAQQTTIISSKAELLRDAHGVPQKVTGVIQDITTRKEAEKALQHYSEHLQEMVEERSRALQHAQEQLVRHEKLAVLGQMAGSVGHELRTPLSTISNAAYYLTMVLPEADGDIAEYLGIIASETRNAEKIIRDLLDFARIKSLERQDVQVADVLELILEKHRPPDSIHVTNSLAVDFPTVLVDPTHLEQVLTNLLSNAFQAMPDGGHVTIEATLHGEQAVITVSDTGGGIAPEHLNTIFDPLFTTKPKGIGLGLAVCKNLVEANGGSIEVQSEEGQGSVFMLRLPTKDAAPIS